MALREFQCARCDEKFKAPNWTCKDGARHQIESKTYYSPVPSWRTYVSEERRELMETGLNRTIPARLVEFSRGTYTTCDPEDQYSLDQQDGCITPEQWKAKYIDKAELNAMKERELDRKINEYNDLVAKAQAQVAGEPKGKGK